MSIYARGEQKTSTGDIRVTFVRALIATLPEVAGIGGDPAGCTLRPGSSGGKCALGWFRRRGAVVSARFPSVPGNARGVEREGADRKRCRWVCCTVRPSVRPERLRELAEGFRDVARCSMWGSYWFSRVATCW